MAVMVKKDQLLYSGKGPLDPKSLVKTYSELLDVNTWTKTIDDVDTFIAYNGMIVAVWLNKDDTSKNGLYYLFDPTVTSTLKRPDVTNESYWHLLVTNTEVLDLITRLSSVETELVEIADYIKSDEKANADILKRIVANEELAQSNFDDLAILKGDAEGSINKKIIDALSALPAATEEALGLVKVGKTLSISEDGTLEVSQVSTDSLVEGEQELVLIGGFAD